ncbi:CvpA family protein [Leeia oryzae]|uniref:CvpA family protein n=1 Tax=Leeia oryzae TaxID=356662 RepID=UPI000377ADD5|nr:CvpA family protein [Leeia oryzae]
MTGFDYLALGIVSVSVVLGVIRGLVKEVLSLLTWVAAYALAQAFYLDVIPWLPAEIPGQPLKVLVAFVLLMLAGWLLMSFVTIAIGELVKLSGLGVVDRALGILFGLIRGVLILCLLVIMAGLTKLPQSSFWREAAFSAPLEVIVADIKPWLPAHLGALVKY